MERSHAMIWAEEIEGHTVVVRLMPGERLFVAESTGAPCTVTAESIEEAIKEMKAAIEAWRKVCEQRGNEIGS